MKFDACMKLVVNQAPILAFAQTDDWATFQALYIRSHASSQPSRNHPIPTPTNEVPKSHLIIQINRQIFLHSDLRPSSQLGRTMIYPASSSLSPCKSSSTPAARPCLSFPSSPSMQASHWLWGCRTRSWSPGRRTSQHRPDLRCPSWHKRKTKLTSCHTPSPPSINSVIFNPLYFSGCSTGEMPSTRSTKAETGASVETLKILNPL